MGIVMTEWDLDLVNDIIDMAGEFIEESKFPVTFERDKVYERISQAFFSEDGDVLLARAEDGEVMGGAIVYAVADWQKEKFGYVEKFFVRSKYRSKGVARIIASSMAEWFDDRECLFSFVTSTANIGAGRLFANLMAKYGYQDLGPTLSREFQNGKVHT